MNQHEHELAVRRWALRHPQPAVEARVLAGLMADPRLADLADLDPDDFTDFRARVAMRAIRELRASGAPHGVLEVADAIEMADLERTQATGVEHSTSEHAGLAYLAAVIARTAPYSLADDELARETFAADVRQLRAIAKELAS